MPGPGQRYGDWRAGVITGLGWVECVSVEGGTQYYRWGPVPVLCEESWGDGRQRVGDPGAVRAENLVYVMWPGGIR